MFLYLVGCVSNSHTEKYQRSRNEIVNVREKIIEVPIEDPFVSSYADFRIIDKYLVFADWKGYDKLISIFDKNSHRHVVSTGTLGQGPNDITYIGDIVADEKNNRFYVFDQGKRKLLSFDLDSLIKDPNYTFTVKANLTYDCPVEMVFIKDTFSIVLHADFNEKTGGGHLEAGSWNMTTNKFTKGYENPFVKKRMYQLAASEEDGIYVTTSSRYDLMTICNLDGSLKYNIYGPNWDERITDICHYNMRVCIGGGKIYALYAGGHYRTAAAPTKTIVFDLKGNYIKTLETELKIQDMCYDKEMHCLFLLTDSDIQFGYLDLEGII